MATEAATWLIAHEASLRFGLFAALFVLFTALEAWAPARARVFSRLRRWGTNLSMVVVSAIVARISPVVTVAAAAWAEATGFGLAHWFAWPAWLAAVAAAVGLDLALYAQHWAMHRHPWLWRLHSAHHADPEVDVSTAVRFHPAEILVSLAWKGAVAAVLGAPVWAVIVFEAALNGCSLFHHANVRLPEAVQRTLGAFLVTPPMHRLHHDAAVGRDAPNLGFSHVLWDRLFRTYRAAPEPATLGLADVAPEAGVKLSVALSLPLRG